jgi:hypothetical protein
MSMWWEAVVAGELRERHSLEDMRLPLEVLEAERL